MAWVPLNGFETKVNMEDKPRLMTDDEIRYVVDRCPKIPSADQATSDALRRGVKNSLSLELKGRPICPSGITELVQTIIRLYEKSLIAPGTPIGVLAAEALGALMTQVTLNSFHYSGSAKSVTFGIEMLKDLILARKTPKNESMTIFFENKRITYEQVLEARRYIVGSMISDFVKDYDIRSPNELSKFWWHDANRTLLGKQIPNSSKVLRLFLDTAKMYKHRVSINTLASVLEREVPPSIVAVFGPIGDGIIDLYPRPEFIAETLRGKKKEAIPPDFSELTYLETVVYPELTNIRVKGISGIRELNPVISPVWKMVSSERKINKEDLTTPDLQEILGPYVGNGWLLYYDNDVMYTNGLLPENLAALCQLANMTIIGGDERRLVITLPNDSYRTKGGSSVTNVNGRMAIKLDKKSLTEFDGSPYYLTPNYLVKEIPTGYLFTVDDEIKEVQEFRNVNGNLYRKLQSTRLIQDGGNIYEVIVNPNVVIKQMNPSDYVKMKIAQEKSARNDEIKRLTDLLIEEAKNLPEAQKREHLRKVIDIPRTPLMEAAEFVIAETDGINMEDIMALPGIDKTRTTCNNMYILTKTLGIEATRNFIVQALYTTITNTGNYITPAHICIIAELITNRGEPYGANFTGISRQPGGHLSLATLERAGSVLTTSAMHGKEDSVQNPSASIVVGRRIDIGDGSFDVIQDITVNGVPKRVINDDLFTALDKDDETIALKQKLIRERPVIQPATIEAGLDELKTITVGGNFDYTAAEDETNLMTLFTQGVQVVDLAAVDQTVTQVGKVVRRAAPTEVPNDLLDILNTIKVGVPREDVPAIKPLQNVIIQPLPVVVEPQVTTQPIVSRGLVVPTGPIAIAETKTDLPDELLNLFGKFQDLLGLPQELPRAEIPVLPELGEFDDEDEDRPAPLGIQPINVQAFREQMSRM